MLAGHEADARASALALRFMGAVHVMQYLSAADRRRVASVLAEAGGRATGRAPLAWLRMEPGGEQAEVRLTLWPGGSERLIASAGFHGRPVRWLATLRGR